MLLKSLSLKLWRTASSTTSGCSSLECCIILPRHNNYWPITRTIDTFDDVSAKLTSSIVNLAFVKAVSTLFHGAEFLFHLEIVVFGIGWGVFLRNRKPVHRVSSFWGPAKFSLTRWLWGAWEPVQHQILAITLRNSELLVNSCYFIGLVEGQFSLIH